MRVVLIYLILIQGSFLSIDKVLSQTYTSAHFTRVKIEVIDAEGGYPVRGGISVNISLQSESGYYRLSKITESYIPDSTGILLVPFKKIELEDSSFFDSRQISINIHVLPSWYYHSRSLKRVLSINEFNIADTLKIVVDLSKNLDKVYYKFRNIIRRDDRTGAYKLLKNLKLIYPDFYSIPRLKDIEKEIFYHFNPPLPKILYSTNINLLSGPVVEAGDRKWEYQGGVGHSVMTRFIFSDLYLRADGFERISYKLADGTSNYFLGKQYVTSSGRNQDYYLLEEQESIRINIRQFSLGAEVMSYLSRYNQSIILHSGIGVSYRSSALKFSKKANFFSSDSIQLSNFKFRNITTGHKFNVYISSGIQFILGSVTLNANMKLSPLKLVPSNNYHLYEANSKNPLDPNFQIEKVPLVLYEKNWVVFYSLGLGIAIWD